jgi:small subunit ribosomal protein S20
MATHKSALKRNRQSTDDRVRNRSVRSHVRARIKNVDAAIETKDAEKARALLAEAIPAIAKAAAKGVFHKRNAARKTSRLTRRTNSLNS